MRIMDKKKILAKIKGGLIVSCQALKDEPLHGASIMAKMALAAKTGGASGIRANGAGDIAAIKKTVDLPVIGIIKKVFKDSDVYITPTLKEVDRLVKAGADIIATDATDRIRPYGLSLGDFYTEVRKKYPGLILMADISTFEEGAAAAAMGFDIVATTLSGYTKYTQGKKLPDFRLLKKLVETLKIPVIAEGGIGEPHELKKAVREINAFAAVVGTAITRPQHITRRFVSCMNERKADR